MNTLKIERTDEREIWCAFEGKSSLKADDIKELQDRVMPLVPGNVRLYLNLRGIKFIDNGAVLSIKRMMTDAMNLGCSIRLTSADKEIDDLVDYLTISSDG
jgi:hypothetical protein